MPGNCGADVSRARSIGLSRLLVALVPHYSSLCSYMRKSVDCLACCICHCSA